MTTLSIFPAGLILFLLWASLASNIVLLMWITINGNAAKRMEGIVSKMAETSRFNSELSKELLKEMSGLVQVNKLLQSAISERDIVIFKTEQAVSKKNVEMEEMTKVILQSDQWVIELLHEMQNAEWDSEVFNKIKTARGWEDEQQSL